MGERAEYEYVVVGSGAGGGVVAARLAEAGHSVLLLEAGGDPLTDQGDGPVSQDRLPEDYKVPSFHAMATENEALSWSFYVRHYADNVQQQKDDKFVPEHDGVFYPRAGALGGCTAHNAMILVYPNNSDWDNIASITDDPSWRAKAMRRHFQRMENCHHRWPYRLIYNLTGLNWTRHGFSGWLSVEKAIPETALEDINLVKVIVSYAKTALKDIVHPIVRLYWLFQSQGDPNDWRTIKRSSVGLHYAPLSTRAQARTGTREFVLDVQERLPDRLTIELHALVTRIELDNSNRATGVVYRKGKHLYRASTQPSNEMAAEVHVRVLKEVVLSGGAFNTPQLLMLSGIGPKAELEKHNIAVRADLPGVGSNLQDRYEVGVVYRLKYDWRVLKGATFTREDLQFSEWKGRSGVYTTNGVALAIINRARAGVRIPDLFMFALLGYFKGYFPGYSRLIATRHNYLTWAILKAYTVNRGGTVRLRSDNPLDTPLVNFHYFQEGSDGHQDDLDAIVDGIEFVRSLTKAAATSLVEEEIPGEHVQGREALANFVRANAWGHHASCSCPIGSDTDPMAVLDSNFRVRGTHNLRVVDASVFPRIPGYFIVSSVYMIGEKAAQAILSGA